MAEHFNEKKEESDVAKIRSALEAVGYRYTRLYSVSSRADRWYIREGQNETIKNVAYLEYKSRSRAYTFFLSVFSTEVQSRTHAAIPLFLPYLHPTTRAVRATYLDKQPCWTMLDPGSVLKWKFRCIPYPLDRATWPADFDDMVNKIMKPLLWPVTDLLSILKLILDDDFTTGNWITSSTVLRTVEIITLAKMTGSEKMVQDQLNARKAFISRDMDKGQDVDEMLSTLWNVL